MSLPVLNLVRGLPTDARELARVFNALNQWVRTNGARTFAADQRFLHPINAANRSSVQDADDIMIAASGSVSSTIGIDAHSVKFDFGSVAYNSGSISGLDPETVYYVYANDPEYEGGAVTYLATTNPDNLVSQGQYYVGFIETPITGDSELIIAATSANPIQFQTSVNHGWANGNSVTFVGLPGDFGTNLNGNTYVITVTGLDTFTIPVDGALYAAYTTGGAATRETVAVQSGGGAGAGVGGGRFDYVIG